MALIARDLMVGNPRLAELGFGEEALGHNAIAAGFQGQRQWTDHFPNGDFMEAILNSSFDWNGIRQPYIVATENDCLNGVSMLFGHLLTNTAQIFADVRTYWSPEAVKRVTGYDADGRGRGRHHPPDQLRRGRPGRHRPADARRQAGHEALLGDHAGRGAGAAWRPPAGTPATLGYFRGGGYSSGFLHPRRHAGDHVPPQPGQGPGPGAADRRRLYRGPARRTCTRRSNERTDPTWPTTWFVPRLTGSGPFRDVYSVMNNWGANHGAISYGHIGARPDHPGLDAAHPGVHAQRAGGAHLPAAAPGRAFGAMDPQGADYRACANFGPLYG